jgi:hypothetical protein
LNTRNTYKPVSNWKMAGGGKQRRQEAKAAAAAAAARTMAAMVPELSDILPPQQSKAPAVPSKTQTDDITDLTSKLEEANLHDDESPEPLARKRQPFRFLDLPAELRLRIYDEVLHVSKPIDLGETPPSNITPEPHH